MASQLHHFVPKFHLKQFIDSTQKRELIWVYERKKPTPELRSLDRVAAQKDFYTVKADDGKKLQHIEELLARLEGSAAPILRRLVDGERRISRDDRSILSLFLSLGCLRTPKFRGAVADLVVESVDSFTRQLTSDSATFAEAVRNTEHALGESLGDPEELRRAYLDGHIKVDANPEYSLKVMLEDALGHASMVEKMVWSLLEADSDVPLVTSDTPVVLNNPTVIEGNGPPTPLALEVICPISPRLLFVATWDGRAGDGEMSGHLTRQMNKLMCLSAEQYVYSSTEIPTLVKYLDGPSVGMFPDFVKEQLRQTE